MDIYNFILNCVIWPLHSSAYMTIKWYTDNIIENIPLTEEVSLTISNKHDYKSYHGNLTEAYYNIIFPP